MRRISFAAGSSASWSPLDVVLPAPFHSAAPPTAASAPFDSDLFHWDVYLVNKLANLSADGSSTWLWTIECEEVAQLER